MSQGKISHPSGGETFLANEALRAFEGQDDGAIGAVVSYITHPKPAMIATRVLRLVGGVSDSDMASRIVGLTSQLATAWSSVSLYRSIRRAMKGFANNTGSTVDLTP